MKMKAVGVFLLITTTIFGQQQPEHRSIILKLSPQHLFEYTLKAGTEYFNRTGNQSLSLFANWTSLKEFLNQTREHHQIRGFGGELQYRYYLKPFRTPGPAEAETFTSLFVMGFGQTTQYRERFESKNVYYDPKTGIPQVQNFFKENRYSTFGGGVAFGMQASFKNILIAELYLGLGRRHSDLTTSGSRFADFVPCDCGPEKQKDHLRYPTLDYNGNFIKAGINLGIPL
jgi:hypothetical protein